ncbi:hypothetical protein FQN57_003006 [Myotisia sp. PD_48]|nr:hypothetical protein FQN57_003006 [Myotisia sp. PD_48]
MKVPTTSLPCWGYLAALLVGVSAAPSGPPANNGKGKDPFAVLDPQKWVDPAKMKWSDFKAPPGTNWKDPSRKGSVRNFNIALVAVDYSNMPFAVTQPVNSTIFNNPQPSGANIKRENVPLFYRDLLNTPNKVNNGHTLHEYWMEDSNGRFGVDLTSFGPYKMPEESYIYGIDDWMNPGECPPGKTCSVEIRDHALAAWRKDVGDKEADAYELVFILSAGQDESSTWQEFGEMKFQKPEDIPAAYGPPGNNSTRNSAKTRYVEWTSWAAASTIWPNAGGGSSTQGESSGMGVYAHELSHLLNIGDNYNNPYGVPPRRAYTGPWSMMSRGSFNGPGGPHTRWQIPALQGGSMGSLHTIRDKVQLGLISNDTVLRLSREALPDSGLVVARITARAVAPEKSQLIGIRIAMNADKGTPCDVRTEPLCDGGGYNGYEVEVVDRMGADSFTPDSGVMLSKSKIIDQGPFQWTIDANPQDIKLLDFHRPDGTPAYITIGDYRQLSDALFHAGTRSGSQYEYIDKGNGLHFYIVDIHRDKQGVLSYTVAVRTADQSKDPHTRKVAIKRGNVNGPHLGGPLRKGVTCSFKLSNTGKYAAGVKSGHPQDVSSYANWDVYRLKASVKSKGWKVELPNALAAAKFGETVKVNVAVAAEKNAAVAAVVKLTATSESDPSVSATGDCVLNKYLNF